MKIFKTTIVALALTLAVGASADTFNTNLKYGMKNADVTALQTKLGVTPATGYFGKITLAAVKAYQTANGISPVSGFVGPLTRASLNSSTPTTPTTPTTPVVLNGQEGFAEYRLSTQPVDNTNITSYSDVPVYGIEFTAKNSDISVERLTLDVSVTSTNGTENPATLINTIMVKDGSTVLATLPVNSSTFSKRSGTSNYYLQISGISTKVAKDTIKTLTVSFNTNPIDTPRTVTVGVGDMGARVIDGRGISTYNSGALTSRTHVFKKAGSATATLQDDSVILYSSNYKVDTNNGTREALTSTFAVKSTTGPAKITAVDVTVNSTGVAATAVYLYQGTTLLASRSISGANATTSFDIENSKVTVAQDTTSTFSIKVDVPSSATSTTVQTTATKITYEKADGTTSTSVASVQGPINYFAPIVPIFAKVSSDLSVNTDNNVVTSLVSTFVMDIKPDGGNVSTTTKAKINLVNSSGAVLASSTVTGALSDSGISSIAEGSTRRVTFQNGFSTSSVSVGASYKAVIEYVTWSPVGGSVSTSTAFSAFDTSYRVR